jgi:hypothetical protein
LRCFDPKSGSGAWAAYLPSEEDENVALLLGFVDGHRDLDSPDGVPAKLRTEGQVPEFKLDSCASRHGLWGRIMCRYSRAAVCILQRCTHFFMSLPSRTSQ